MTFEEHLPLDPDCPDNPMGDFWNDPMTAYSGCGDELAPLIESRHRAKCERCRMFGVENIEIEEAI